jgi:hypothetical protein
MRRKIGFVCLIMLILIAFNSLGWAQGFNFRHTRWGMTQEEVLASEDIDPIEKQEKRVLYDTKILNKSVNLIYLFVNNTLVGASYKLTENYLVSTKFIKTYNAFKTELIKKYGKPRKDMVIWINDRYKGDNSKWGLALSLGHLEYVSVWATPASNIKCSMRGENYNILCLIEYSSIEHFNLLNKGQSKQKKKVDPF